MKAPASETHATTSYLDDVVSIIRRTLQMPDDRVLTADTPLLGAVPEFDSMSVVTVMTDIEDRFGFIVEDDEVSADTFATIGALHNYVLSKLEA